MLVFDKEMVNMLFKQLTQFIVIHILYIILPELIELFLRLWISGFVLILFLQYTSISGLLFDLKLSCVTSCLK